MSRLTTKQQAFSEAYLETLNATEAARRAKYKGSYATLRSIGSENLTKPNIQEYIEKRLKDMAMSANEVLARLSKQARAPDVTEFVQAREIYDVTFDGEKVFVGMGLSIDLEAIRKAGLGSQIKKISQTSNGIAIEWYDAHAALVDLGKYHKLFTEKVEHSGSVEVKTDDDERYDRAISTLADALREALSDTNRGAESPMDTPE